MPWRVLMISVYLSKLAGGVCGLCVWLVISSTCLSLPVRRGSSTRWGGGTACLPVHPPARLPACLPASLLCLSSPAPLNSVKQQINRQPLPSDTQSQASCHGAEAEAACLCGLVHRGACRRISGVLEDGVAGWGVHCTRPINFPCDGNVVLTLWRGGELRELWQAMFRVLARLLVVCIISPLWMNTRCSTSVLSVMTCHHTEISAIWWEVMAQEKIAIWWKWSPVLWQEKADRELHFTPYFFCNLLDHSRKPWMYNVFFSFTFIG